MLVIQSASRRAMERTVLLADDNPSVRLGLRVLIEAQPGFVVVAETSRLGAIRSLLATLRPRLLLLDWELPGMGAAALGGLLAACPHLRVVALSGRPEARAAALAAGAAAFVSRTDPPERVLEALTASA
jgi:DNA-binding NarL/FixJ family response regulator